MTNYLNEAFQRLSLLEDDFPLSNDKALEKLQEYMADDIEMPEEEVIIDPEAEVEDDLQDNYVGKIIIECGACHTRLYKDEEDVVVDEETNMANVGEECPVCGATTGYNVIGKIEQYDADRDIEKEAEKIEDGEEEDDLDLVDDDEEVVDSEGEEEDDDEIGEALKEVLKEEPKEDEDLDEALNEDDLCPECGNNPCTCKKHKKVNEMKNSDKLKKKLQSLKEEECEEGCKEEELEEELEQSDLEASDVLAVEDDKKLEDPNDDPVEEDPQVLEEDLDEVEVHTDEGDVNVSKEGSKVTVDFGAGEGEAPATEDEMIVPLDSEEQADIEANEPEGEEDLGDLDLGMEEEPVEGGEEEGDFDEFDEESFDEMGESYMRRVYENVKGFKTSNVTEANDQLIVEGIITFESGKHKPTKFIFENARETKRGKVVLEGINKTFSDSKKAFILKGSVKDNKYISESMIYSYNTKQLNESNESEVVKVHGRIKRK